MSRKKTQPKKNVIPDPKFNSTIIPKLINNIMYDGKRGVAAKIVYDAIEKIKTKSKDEPIKIFSNKESETKKLDITLQLNKILEQMIVKDPSQWIWTHNRWK